MSEQFIAEEIIRLFVAGIVLGVPLWKIFNKAGFGPWWMLMLFIPPFGVGPLFIMLFLAFRKWPSTEMGRL